MSRANNDIFSGEEPKEEKAEQVKQKEYQNISHSLDWEVPIESAPIPSKGLIYDKDSFFYMKDTIDIKSMTAKEEDILMSSAYQKRGVVMEELIKSCIGKVGVDPMELIIGDKNALLISIRITGYGSSYDTSITCPKCSFKREKRFDLSNLGINRLGAEPIEQGRNAFLYHLPVSKKKVVFKLLNGYEEEAKNKEILEIEKKLGPEAAGSVTNSLMHSIISIDGITNKIEIRKFINAMPARDSKSLRDFIIGIQPGIDTQMNYDCENCGQSTLVYLPITAKFFFPD